MFEFLKKKKDKKLGAMDKLRSGNNVVVTYSELSEIPYGFEEQVYKQRPDSLICTRIKSHKKGILNFHVKMKKGEVWLNHQHDCTEVIIVHKGAVYDKESKKTTARLESMVIPPYTSHNIKALDYTEIYVQFTK